MTIICSNIAASGFAAANLLRSERLSEHFFASQAKGFLRRLKMKMSCRTGEQRGADAMSTSLKLRSMTLTVKRDFD